MRVLAFVMLGVAFVACGGKIDDGTDSGVDSGGVDSGFDSPSPPPICKPNGSICSTSSQCCSNVCDPTGACVPNAPTCKPDGAPCTSPQQCCSQFCPLNGTCNTPPPPPPPPCKPDGSQCSGASECCSNTCNGGTCGVSVGCATTSNKKCDMCVAQSCCSQEVACENDATCSNWLSCIQNCEQKNLSAMTCSGTSYCGLPSTVAGKALYACGQQFCSQPCSID